MSAKEGLKGHVPIGIALVLLQFIMLHEGRPRQHVAHVPCGMPDAQLIARVDRLVRKHDLILAVFCTLVAQGGMIPDGKAVQRIASARTHGKRNMLGAAGCQHGNCPKRTFPRRARIRDAVLDTEGLALEFIKIVKEIYPENLRNRYNVTLEEKTPLEIYEAIGKNRGFLLRGGEIDYTRTAAAILDDFRKGRMGKMILELPQ